MYYDTDSTSGNDNTTLVCNLCRIYFFYVAREYTYLSSTSIIEDLSSHNELCTRNHYHFWTGYHLYEIGVTEDMIHQKEKEDKILEILRSQGVIAGSQVGSGGQSQLLGAVVSFFT